MLIRNIASQLWAERMTQSWASNSCTIIQSALILRERSSLPKEMVEWIRGCELMITNDTGPMHVAAALHKPVVALFGPTNPHRTGPYGQLENVLQGSLPCIPCMRPRCTYIVKNLECLRQLTPDIAAKSARRTRFGGAG